MIGKTVSITASWKSWVAAAWVRSRLATFKVEAEEHINPGSRATGTWAAKFPPISLATGCEDLKPKSFVRCLPRKRAGRALNESLCPDQC